MSLKKVIKKLFLIVISVAVFVLASSLLAAYLFQDEIKNHFISEMNKHLNTPVKVGKIEVSTLDNFPNVSLRFSDVYIEESFSNSSDPLLKAKSISFSFDLLQIYLGTYKVKKIDITNGIAYFKVSKNGVTNYEIFKSDASNNSKNGVSLDLSSITLSDFEFKYVSRMSNVSLECSTKKVSAAINIRDKEYEISAVGDVLLSELLINEKAFANNKLLSVNTNLVYNDELKAVYFKNSNLGINNSQFSTYGTYSFSDIPEIEFFVEAKKTTLETVLNILPQRVSEPLEKYKTLGDLTFDLSLKGKFEDNKLPSLHISFGLLDSEVIYPENDINISKAHAEGSFLITDLKYPERGVLDIYNMSGLLEGKPFSGKMVLKNLNDPSINLEFNGIFENKALIAFLGQTGFKNTSGNLKVDLSINGKINDLKKKETAYNVKTSGEVEFIDVAFEYEDLHYPIKGLVGNILFNTNDVAISGIKGMYGSSDFLINGYFKNIIAYLLFKNEPIGIEADLKSKFINLNELLNTNDSEASNYNFQLNPKLLLKFNCDVDELSFRRFKPKNIKGDLKIKNQMAYTDQLEFNNSGGRVTLTGTVDAKNTNYVDINSSFTIDKVNIDSAFYVFENFNQEFLKDENLKGKIKADVETSMKLKPNLQLIPESLSATISASILGGELNNFEPMQKLSKYIEEDKLDHLTFSELTNEIFIEDKTIYLPQMEVSSNITTIKIGGTHTFDQEINYQVITPLRTRKKIDPDEAFGAIEEDGTGQSKLYLKIIGTTSDYKIMYDKDRVKEKIITDLKKEVDELKKAFKNKGLEKKKTIELEEDDYFDWEEDGKGN